MTRCRPRRKRCVQGHRLTVQGRALWLQRGGGASALDLNAALLVTLFQTHAAAPFVVIGGGLYRARVDLSNQNIFGRMGSSVGPGMTLAPLRSFGSGMLGGDMSGGTTWMDVTHGSTVDVRAMPMFYATRLGSLVLPRDGRWQTPTFVDPAMTVGFGVQVDVSDRVYLQPDLRAVVAFRDGNSLALTDLRCWPSLLAMRYLNRSGRTSGLGLKTRPPRGPLGQGGPSRGSR